MDNSRAVTSSGTLFYRSPGRVQRLMGDLFALTDPSQDTILIVENFINKKKKVLGHNLIPCQNGYAHDCLDSLVFYDNKRSFKWVTPNKHSIEKDVKLKRYSINLK